jgi:glycosyltransferase involved in cell wall biosynthesis
LPALVRAFARLDSACRLFILGSGPLEEELRRICASQGIGNVSFGGHIPQAELLRYTAHADLGMIPYEDAGLLNMRYCSPNKLFEFIEAKVPICASMLPELSRLVTENKIGAAYHMGSADEIAAAIRDCRQRCERGEFTGTTRENARQKFAWSEQSKRLLALYEGLGV